MVRGAGSRNPLCRSSASLAHPSLFSCTPGAMCQGNHSELLFWSVGQWDSPGGAKQMNIGGGCKRGPCVNSDVTPSPPHVGRGAGLREGGAGNVFGFCRAVLNAHDAALDPRGS